MCGIAGFIGHSSHPEVSYELITGLFDYCETRGTDASGYYAVERQTGNIFYHKCPERSSEFIKSDIWEGLGGHDFDLMMVHARGASSGVGTPKINSNNHPFVSEDRTIALIHNGRIPDSEYKSLKTKYEVKTRCDSEILLRIFEAGALADDFSEFQEVVPETFDNQITHRLMGLKEIWSQVVRGAMAVGISERLSQHDRRLWLFRNRERPMWAIDLRRDLGQIFFASTIDIWKGAVFYSPTFQKLCRNKVKMINLPTEEIWALRISEDQPVVQDKGVLKFGVESHGFSSFEYEGKPIPIQSGEPLVPTFSFLDEEEDPIEPDESMKAICQPSEYDRTWLQEALGEHDDAADAFDEDPNTEISDNIDEVDNTITSIQQLLEEIGINAHNKNMESSLTVSQHNDIVASLEQIETDLQGTLQMLE